MDSGKRRVSIIGEDSPIVDEDLQALASVPDLVELDLSGTEVGSKGIEYLARNKSLSIVRLDFLQIDDASIRCMSQMPALKKLSIHATDINGSVFQSSTFPALEILDIGGCPLGDNVFQGLATATPRLRRLDLAGCRLKKTDWPEISSLIGLEELDLYSTDLTDSTVLPLLQLKNLKILTVEDTAISDEGGKLLSQLSTLAEVRVTGTRVTAKSFFGCRALRRIDLDGGTDAEITSIAALPTLETVALSMREVTRDGEKQLFQMPRLKTLTCMEVQDLARLCQGMAHASALADVMVLVDHPVGGFVNLPDLAFREMKSSNITDICISGCELSAPHIEQLLQMPRLCSLHLWGCRVDERALMHVNKLAKLRTLFISTSHWSAEGRHQLLMAIPHART